MKSFSFKDYLVHIVAVVLFFLCSAAYFAPQFSGKKISQSDTIFNMGMSQEIKDYHEETGIWSQWTNSGFGGMPAYQIYSLQTTNLTVQIRKAMSLWMPRPAGMFFFGAICFYIMALVLRVNPWLGIIGALAFSFTTNNMVLFEAGHNTKVLTIMTIPLVVAGVIEMYRYRYLSGMAIFTLGMALCLGANHPQMTYYLGICLAIYTFMKLGSAIKNGKVKEFVIASALLLAGALIGFGTSSSRLIPTYEYGKDTMRGAPILELTGEPKSSSEVDGLEWGYATAWSNGAKDLWSSFVPLAVGGSSRERIDKGNDIAKEMRKNRLDNSAAPLYFGALISTSGPIYFGAVICFLFLFCFQFLDPKLRWWGVGSVVLTLLLSMGNNMEWLYRIFFDYFPLFNKFRTPNSILSVTAAIIPIVAILSLDQFFKKDKADIKAMSIFIPAGILAGLSLLLAFGGSSFMDMAGQSDARYVQMGISAEVLQEARASLMRGSALRSAVLIVLAAGVLWLYLKDKLNAGIAMLIVGLLAVGDVILTDLRYVNKDDFMSARNYKQIFAKTAADELILKDNDPHFRVMDVTGNPWSDTRASYHHKSIGGMHAAKLQRYNDIIERHLSNNNMNVYNMLNTKYFIVPAEGGRVTAQANTASLGNAWIVDNIQMVPSANQEIDNLTSFDPATTAIIHNEFQSYLGSFDPVKSGNIKFIKYAPDYLEYESYGNTDQLAVFSEVWYGPNKGWQAYIDDEPVDHIRANYVLRALKIPPGKHKITFKFDPASYKTGKILSLVSSLITIGLLLFWAFTAFRRKDLAEV